MLENTENVCDQTDRAEETVAQHTRGEPGTVSGIPGDPSLQSHCVPEVRRARCQASPMEEPCTSTLIGDWVGNLGPGANVRIWALKKVSDSCLTFQNECSGEHRRTGARYPQSIRQSQEVLLAILSPPSPWDPG